MTKHTEGPWTVDTHHASTKGGRTLASITNGKDLVPVAVVTLGVDGYGREEGEANARLIAAAPDLLDALRIVKTLDLSDVPGDVVRAIDAALARATSPTA